MNAESREAVFAELRKQGIKAIKVVAADGSKANGEIRGVRKRVVVLFVGCAVVLTGVAVFILTSRSSTVALPKNAAQPLPRQEIVGDRSRIGKPDELFVLKAERFLARFAEPGRSFDAPESEWPSKADFEAAVRNQITFTATEFTERIDFKRMVSWLKVEYVNYIRGGGYVSGYIKDLIKRQQMEIGRREEHERHLQELLVNVKSDHKKQREAYDYWLKANAQLQSMGIYQLSLPYALQGCQGSVGF